MKLYLPIFIIGVLFMSCSIEKRHYSKGYFVSKPTKTKVKTNQVEVESESEHGSSMLPSNLSTKVIEHKSEEIVPKEDTTKCDRIVFRDSHQEEVVVKEISDFEIKYRKCGFEDGPLYTVSPAKVSAILYRNGTKEFYGNYVKPSEEKVESEDYINGYTTWASDPREIEVFSVLSFVFSLIYIIPGLSIIFGFIGLRMFQKEPGKYKGKGFAYAGIIIGAISILLLLLLIFI